MVVANKEISPSYLDRADIVIVGNGIAGLTAAVEARRLDPGMQIVIITDQCHPTINTPALKQFAIGKLEREQLLAYPAGTERAQRIHVVQARVEGINAAGKFLSLEGGRGFGYGSLLIATGSKPNGLPASTPGRDFDGVLTLHRLSDYLDLRRRLPEVQQAVVIGGGVHAIETVMGLLHCGVAVHWLVRSATIMPNILDQPASTMVLEHIQHLGAKVHVETEVVGIVGRVGAVAGVITNQSEMIPCQMVLVCTGTRAVTTLAQHCSEQMLHKNGILVDDWLRTSVRDVYAAGDVAALKNPLTGKYEPRAQWYSAVLQGRIVAAAMTGRDETVESSFGVPWHATHVGELSMLTVGNPLRWSENATTLTDSSKGSYRRMTLVGERLVGYLSLGPKQPDSLALKRIIDEGLPVTDIKKALLKGTFDARMFLSRRRSNAAHTMLTTGKLPDISSDKLPALVRPLPGTGPLSPEQNQRQVIPMPAARTGGLPDTGPLAARAAVLAPMPVPVARSAPRPAPLPAPAVIVAEEEISPFTGRLPGIPKGAADTGRSVQPVQRQPVPVQQSAHIRPTPDRAPLASSAKLPAIDGNNGRGKRPMRNLWSYSEKLPAVNGNAAARR